MRFIAKVVQNLNHQSQEVLLNNILSTTLETEQEITLANSHDSESGASN